MIAIPPKRTVFQVVGCIKGRSAIRLAQVYGERERLGWATFWARGCFERTVGHDEAMIRFLIRNQEETRFGQLGLCAEQPPSGASSATRPPI